MNFLSVRNFLGRILEMEAIILALPLIVCEIYRESLWFFQAFFLSSAVCLFCGMILRINCRNHHEIHAKEGLVITGLAWLLMTLFGTLPFIISTTIPNFFDAFFEIVSGYTTTGASILTDVESLNHSILFYRSLSQWFGGMGILVLAMAFANSKTENTSIHLLRAESTGISVGKLSTKMRFNTQILYLMYVGLTLLQIIFMLIAGNNLFTSVCISLSTLATGGFSILNTGCATYSIFTQYIIIVFMFLAGVNFALFYFLLIRKFKKFFRNEELRTYGIIVIAATTIIALNLFSKFKTAEPCIREALFTVVSLITTTGFSISDFASWPALSLFVLCFVMLTGACAGSTAGGLKISRLIIITKSSFRRIDSKISENKVKIITLDKEVMNDNLVNETKTFFTTYILILILFTFLISIDGTNDLISNFTASLTCLSNVGPGLGNIGPTSTFVSYSWYSKLFLSIEMLVGRLELYPILVLFNKNTWSRY